MNSGVLVNDAVSLPDKVTVMMVVFATIDHDVTGSPGARVTQSSLVVEDVLDTVVLTDQEEEKSYFVDAPSDGYAVLVGCGAVVFSHFDVLLFEALSGGIIVVSVLGSPSSVGYAGVDRGRV